MGGRSAHLPGAARGRGVRSDLPHAGSGARGRRRRRRRRCRRPRRHDLLVLLARRSRGHLRVDAGRRSPACPPRPDHSQGYVWALYRNYDIYRANADGSGARRLTTTDGYDAEGTVCGKDGSIVFTSVRDGDIDLYRMDTDGKNVRRLTHDGRLRRRRVLQRRLHEDRLARVAPEAGAGARRVPPPARAEPGASDEARALRRQRRRQRRRAGHVSRRARRSRAWPVADAAPRRAAHRSSRRTTAIRTGASSTSGPIDVDGTRLERITTAPGFDGFPMFSPDGKRLAFSSNRATPAGRSTTPTSSSPTGTTRRAAGRRARRRRSHRSPTCAGSPIPRARGAASAPRASTPPAPTSRSASARSGLRAGRRRRRLPPAVRRTHRRHRRGPRRRLATRRHGAAAPTSFVPLGLLGAAARPSGPLVLAGYGLRDRRRRHRRLRGPRRQRQDRRRAPLRARAAPRTTTPERAAPRGRSAPEGVGRARARRARAAGRRLRRRHPRRTRRRRLAEARPTRRAAAGAASRRSR